MIGYDGTNYFVQLKKKTDHILNSKERIIKMENYSVKKGIENTVQNSLPVIVVVLANVINKNTINLDDTTLNAVLTTASVGYYWIKNWIKNRNGTYNKAEKKTPIEQSTIKSIQENSILTAEIKLDTICKKEDCLKKDNCPFNRNEYPSNWRPKFESSIEQKEESENYLLTLHCTDYENQISNHDNELTAHEPKA